jgi:hypothetical protein
MVTLVRPTKPSISARLYDKPWLGAADRLLGVFLGTLLFGSLYNNRLRPYRVLS